MDIVKINEEISKTEERLNKLRNLKTGYVEMFGESVRRGRPKGTKESRPRRGRYRRCIPAGDFHGQEIQQAIKNFMGDGKLADLTTIANGVFGKSTQKHKMSVTNAIALNREYFTKVGKQWKKI